MKILIVIAIIVICILLYSMLLVAKTSDEQAERMYQEYMKWKKKHEKEKEK